MSADFADGFDVEVIGDVSDDLICVICSKLMKDAVEMSCGHGMCEGCCKKLIQSCKNRNVASSCPQCRKNIKENEIRPVMMVRRLISSLKINCPEENMGCDWKGELGNLKDHDQHCPYGYVTCPNGCCLQKMIRKNLEEHSMKCDYRSIECCHCGIDYVAKDHQSHLGLCKMFPLPCPRDCGEIVKRNEISDHLNECLVEVIKCPYYHAGCNTKVQRKAMKDHLKGSTEEHMLLVYERCLTKDAEINVLKDEVATLKKELAISKKEVADLKTKSDFQRKLMDYQGKKYKIILRKLNPNWQLHDSFSVYTHGLPMCNAYLLNQHYDFDLLLTKTHFGLYFSLEKSIQELLDEGYIKEEHYYIGYYQG